LGAISARNPLRSIELRILRDFYFSEVECALGFELSGPFHNERRGYGALLVEGPESFAQPPGGMGAAYQVLSPAPLITCLALKAGKAGKQVCLD
jgi:hypothetical protein